MSKEIRLDIPDEVYEELKVTALNCQMDLEGFVLQAILTLLFLVKKLEKGGKIVSWIGGNVSEITEIDLKLNLTSSPEVSAEDNSATKNKFNASKTLIAFSAVQLILMITLLMQLLTSK